MANEHMEPNEAARKIYEDCKESYEDGLKETDLKFRRLKIAEHAMGYWNNVSPSALGCSSTGGTAIANLYSVQQQAAKLRISGQNSLLNTQQMDSLFTGYGAITNTANDFVFAVDSYSSNEMNAVLNSYQRDELYAQKFERFNVEIGKIYRQTLEIQSRTTSYPQKSILPDIRQAFDTLLNKLVPDNSDVKQRSWWPDWETHGTNPSKVSTPQRIRYAAEKYVEDAFLQEVLITQSKHMLNIHRQLSEMFHGTGTIDTIRAQSASQTMISTLNQWADALGL